MLFCNYLGCIFTLLEFNKFYVFTKNLYFIPPIALFGLYFALGQYLKGKIPSRKPREPEQNQKPAEANNAPSEKKDN